MALQNHRIHLYLHDGREGKGDFLLLLDIREELKDLNAALFTFTHRKEARNAFFSFSCWCFGTATAAPCLPGGIASLLHCIGLPFSLAQSCQPLGDPALGATRFLQDHQEGSGGMTKLGSTPSSPRNVLKCIYEIPLLSFSPLLEFVKAQTS